MCLMVTLGFNLQYSSVAKDSSDSTALPGAEGRSFLPWTFLHGTNGSENGAQPPIDGYLITLW